MFEFFAIILGAIWRFLQFIGMAIIKAIEWLWEGGKWLAEKIRKKNAINLVRDFHAKLTKTQSENLTLLKEAESVVNVLPDIPEKITVNELIAYCKDIDSKLQIHIDNVNQDKIRGTLMDAAFFKTKYSIAQQLLSTIHYSLSLQELYDLQSRFNSDNFFIDTLLEYSQVENLVQQNGVWTYSAHGITYQLQPNESDNTLCIKAKAQNPIRFNPNPHSSPMTMSSVLPTLYFDENNELVFSLKKSMATIDHYDVFEYFDYISHLLNNKQINPMAGKQLLTSIEAESIEDSVVDNVKDLGKIAPPPPDYVPDSQKMHGGTMRWANYFDVQKCGMLLPQGFILGKMGYGSYLYTGKYSGHILTVAATRTGKGVGVVIPNLLLHKGSVVVLDPKGENFSVTANKRIKLENKVFYYDPWDVIPELEKKKHGSLSVEAVKACINPLDIIGQNDKDMLDKALMLSSSLIVRSSSNDVFFYNEAETFLARLIVFVCAKYPMDNPHRSLVEVRKLLNYDLPRLKMELTADTSLLMRSPIDEFVKWIDRNIAAKSRATNNVIDVAQQATTFLSSIPVANSLKKSNIDIMRMKVDPTSLYLILDTNKILFNEDVYKPLVRLVVTTCFCVALFKEQPKDPMLFMLDEIAQLGNLQYLPKLLSISAGSGVVIWMIWQSLAQIKSLYDKDAETITGNCSIQQYFGVNDVETADLICKMAGKTTIFEETYTDTFGTSTTHTQTQSGGGSQTQSSSSSSGVNNGRSYQGFNFTISSGTTKSTSESKSYSDSYSFSNSIARGETHSNSVALAKKTADLITSAEVMQANGIGVQFLFCKGMCPYPVLCGKIAYYEDKEFYGLFDENYTRN